MNALNVNRHRFSLGLVHQFLAAARMQVTGHNISDCHSAGVEKLDNCEVSASSANLDSKEALARVNNYYGSIHVDTSTLF